MCVCVIETQNINPRVKARRVKSEDEEEENKKISVRVQREEEWVDGDVAGDETKNQKTSRRSSF